MYEVKTDGFVGPLSLLLSLIEGEKLDITKVSLATVADQYLAQIDAMGETKTAAELADFLVVAAKLLLIKSAMLLPAIEFEEEDADSLERQLKIYKAYRDAAFLVRAQISEHRFLFPRVPLKIPRVVTFTPPEGVNKNDLSRIMRELINQIAISRPKLPKNHLARVVSIGERIAHLRALLSAAPRTSFSLFLKTAKNKAEVIISFLALLELIKQKELIAGQDNGEIVIQTQ